MVRREVKTASCLQYATGFDKQLGEYGPGESGSTVQEAGLPTNFIVFLVAHENFQNPVGFVIVEAVGIDII